jgi:hypothetical protein
MIYAPENSIIQFPASDVISSCVIVPSKCLPITRSSDINFQIIIDDVEAAPASNEYVMKLFTTCDTSDLVEVPAYIYGTDEEVFATIAWTHMTDEGIAYGFMTQTNDDFDFGQVFENGDCFRIGIVRVNSDSYKYANFFEVTGSDVTIKLTINGVEQTLGIFDYSTPDDIADAIRSYISDQVTVLQAVNTSYVSITIHSLSGDTYGNFKLGGTTYAATVTAGEDDIVACSNCFVYKADPCFTTVLKYRNSENAFGFNYEADDEFYNKVRVGMYIDNPQPVDTENVYRQSNGVYKTLSAMFESVSEGHVDYYDKQRHFAIAMAMRHDDFSAAQNNEDEFTGYVRSGAYEIAWQNKPGINLDAAPASFKVKETPYYQINSNCL